MTAVNRGLLALGFLCACAILTAADRKVEIQSARSTEYSGATDGNGNETVRFVGAVTIVVTEGSSVSTISADEILYDKTHETLNARGNVRYERKTGATGGQTFTGEALLFNIKDQEGEFLAGAVTQDSGKKNSDPYIVHAEISGRDSGTTMAFRNGVLTTCDDPDPHWSIKASRIWLLPGNEIALLNGVFFIGPLPILYIPAFYYPSDEMLVNPVFGVRNRTGAFVQTTTYLMGRKPLAKASGDGSTSFSNFLQSDSLKEQKLDGLFYRNLETDEKDVSGEYLKLMVDAYSSLGGMLGLEGSFAPKTSYVKNISFSGLFAVSRTLYPPVEGLSYSTWDSDGNQNANSGWAFGYETPLRFRLDFSVSMDRKPFNVSIKIPFMSDPFVKQDFLDRSEDLNWFNYLLQQDKLAEGTTLATETSYAWNVNGAVTPSVSFLNPWIETATIQKIAGSMTFNSKVNDSVTGSEASYSPERSFFYPQKLVPEMALAFGGTLIAGSAGETASDKPVKSVEAGISGGLPNPFIENAPNTETESAEKSGLPSTDSLSRIFPGIPLAAPSDSGLYKADWSLKWTFKPSAVEEITYDATDWAEPSDVDWNSYSSLYYQVKNAANLKGDLKLGTALSLTSSLDFSSTAQEHPWMSDEANTKTQLDTARLNDLKASIWLLSSTDHVQLTPFAKTSVFSPSSVSWDFRGDLAKSVFSGSVDDPEWKTEKFKWEKDYVKAHSAAMTAGLNLADNIQSIKITSSLDPLLQSYKGDASFSWSPLSLTASTRLFEKENLDKRWFWDPFTSTAKVAMPFSSSLSQTWVYDIENEQPSSLTYALSTPYVNAGYALNNTIPYVLVPGSGWVADGTEKKFIPTSANLSLNNARSPLKVLSWKNRISLEATLTSTLKFDLLRITDSSFAISPNITFKMHEFLDLTFKSTSENGVIARYFQDYVDLPIVLPGETNPLTDLAQSFYFWDTKARTQSGYKLTSLSLSATHYLHDWTATFTTTVQPELITDSSRSYYDFKPIITFMVQWKPISDIKTSVKSEKGAFTLNTTSSDSTTQ